jgi:hypothetical protein
MNVKFDPTARAVDETDFNGQVDISFKLLKSTMEILFHAHKQLVILDPIVLVNKETNTNFTVLKEQHMPAKNDYHYIKLNSPLAAGSYIMIVKFENSNRSLFGNRGMFAAKYLDDLVERLVDTIPVKLKFNCFSFSFQRTFVATAFSPNEARKVFPCFDEPRLKATFDITIQHPIGSFVLSNAQELVCFAW